MSPELDFAIQTARLAGETALRYFKSGIGFDRKSDDSPVTVADREVEEFIRQRIKERFPDDGVVGEEYGTEASASDRIWVIDPIDGTKSFVYRVPLFGVLIGLQVFDKPVLGVADFPGVQETYWAQIGEGAFRNGAPIRVSEQVLSNGLLVSGSFQSMERHGRLDGFAKLAQSAYVSRTWGDAYGHCMVADGRAVAMVDPVVNLWDTCALYPIVKEAGGWFTNFRGEDGHTHGEAVSTCPAVFEEVIAAYRE
jgi:histidinol phosphatase-like enzyme (inositol monophosphatase family)